MNKIIEVTALINDNRPDVFGVTKSWTSSAIMDSEISISGYTSIRIDRRGNRSGGGFILYINEELQFTPFNLPDNTYDSLEIIAVNIILDSGPFIVLLVYRSPACTLEVNNSLLNTISGLENVNRMVFVMLMHRTLTGNQAVSFLHRLSTTDY